MGKFPESIIIDPNAAFKLTNPSEHFLERSFAFRGHKQRKRRDIYTRNIEQVRSLKEDKLNPGEKVDPDEYIGRVDGAELEEDTEQNQ